MFAVPSENLLCVRDILRKILCLYLNLFFVLLKLLNLSSCLFLLIGQYLLVLFQLFLVQVFQLSILFGSKDFLKH
jgi:hypothetical protein